ncbi:hypothetical protein V8G54_012407 [Vigna mungo]|uniref:Uncharacterized protein n=1 Tax=Vigna mungo TaxID=3915 RepID=A0AAQ3NTQ0_VIGMU
MRILSVDFFAIPSHRPSRLTAISSFLLHETGPNSEILPFSPPSLVVVATTWTDEAVGAFNATLPCKSSLTKPGSSLLLTGQEHHHGPPSSSSLAQTLLPSITITIINLGQRYCHRRQNQPPMFSSESLPSPAPQRRSPSSPLKGFLSSTSDIKNLHHRRLSLVHVIASAATLASRGGFCHLAPTRDDSLLGNRRELMIGSKH